MIRYTQENSDVYMRRFNPDKELYKIQHGNKNKIIIGVIALLLIISIGSTYALYQVRYSKRIIYTKVAPFSNHDIELAVLIDGKAADDFPEKDDGKIYERIDCGETKVKVYWDYDKWALVIETNKKAKCNVYFKTGTSSSGEKLDTSGANPPELYQGLIPVTFGDNGKVLVANPTNNDWYNYDEKRWANAVLVNTTKYNDLVYNGLIKEEKYGTEIGMSDILQMYVWIPRYKYQLFNSYNGNISEQMINIKFENGTDNTGDVSCEIDSKGKETCINALNGNWYTHPAFTFGRTELLGIWVGKFETSGTTTNLRIIPGVTPLTNVTTNDMFNASRNIEETYSTNFNLDKEKIDIHMTKNTEWGAMAYLTQSKYGRCEANGICTRVTVNSVGSTGYTSGKNTWNTENGFLASSSGSIYGIYDINGPCRNRVMGIALQSNGSITHFNPIPDEKYYDKYEYGTDSAQYSRGHLGDATREIVSGSGNVAWYGQGSLFPTYSAPGITHGGFTTGGGPFYYRFSDFAVNGVESFRISLTAQDGVS